MSKKEYEILVRNAINSNKIINADKIIKCLPPRESVRSVLEKPPINISDRSFRVILVEDLGEYKIYIQIPGKKSDYDFFVWRAIFRDNKIIDLRIPTHDYLGRMYLELRNKYFKTNKLLLKAIIRFIKDRECEDTIIQDFVNMFNESVAREIRKFLLTLKWIAIQEDANYPPPKLGSLYTLSVYILLDVFEDISIIRRIIRF